VGLHFAQTIVSGTLKMKKAKLFFLFLILVAMEGPTSAEPSPEAVIKLN